MERSRGKEKSKIYIINVAEQEPDESEYSTEGYSFLQKLKISDSCFARIKFT